MIRAGMEQAGACSGGQTTSPCGQQGDSKEGSVIPNSPQHCSIFHSPSQHQQRGSLQFVYIYVDSSYLSCADAQYKFIFHHITSVLPVDMLTALLWCKSSVSLYLITDLICVHGPWLTRCCKCSTSASCQPPTNATYLCQLPSLPIGVHLQHCTLQR